MLVDGRYPVLFWIFGEKKINFAKTLIASTVELLLYDHPQNHIGVVV